MPLDNLQRTPDGVHLVWTLPAGREAVWRHLTDPVHLPEWLGAPASVPHAVGERLVLDHGEAMESVSEVLGCEPGRFADLTWEFPDEPASRLACRLVSDADAPGVTHLVLSHTRLGDLGASYAPGWQTHLAYLEASLAGTPLPPQEFWDRYAALGEVTDTRTALSAERVVDAPRRAVWELLADPARHHEADATGMVGGLVSEPPSAVGDVFRMAMSWSDGSTRERYESDNHVVVWQPETAIEWATALPDGEPLGWTWRYELQDAGSRTRVRLWYDWSATPPGAADRFGVPLVRLVDLARSLELLDAAVTPSTTG